MAIAETLELPSLPAAALETSQGGVLRNFDALGPWLAPVRHFLATVIDVTILKIM